MSKKLKILVDMDDVMEDLRGAWVDAINEIWGTPIKEHEITTWDIASIFEPYIECPKDIFNILNDEWFWARVKPLPGAVNVLNQLRLDGHEIYVVTATSPETYLYKIEWILERWFQFIPRDHVIVTYNKAMINGDVLIDDGPHNLVGANLPRLKLLMDAPYNQDVDLEANNIIRVKSWRDIYNQIQLLLINYDPEEE